MVTGAGQGIGRAIAARLLQEGARVVLWERERSSGEDARDELSELGDVELQVVDVADAEGVARSMDQLENDLGALHVVVNNAADQRTFGVPLEKLRIGDVRQVLETNLLAPLHIVQRALPLLRASRGNVIQLSSTRALMSEPDTFAYTASKGGLSALTHSLAASLGPEVRVNAIAPGWIATDRWLPRGRRREPALDEEDHLQHPVGRVGRPEDVAALAAFLASDEAEFVTGQIWTTDGGMTRKMIYAE